MSSATTAPLPAAGSTAPTAALARQLERRVPLLAALVVAVLVAGVVASLRLTVPVAEDGAPSPLVVLPATTVEPLAVTPAVATPPTPTAAPAPAAPPPASAPAPQRPVPAASAAAPAAPATRPAAPTPVADPLCTGAGWEQRRGEAALASLRRPSDASAFTVEFMGADPSYLGLATVHERRMEVFVRTCEALSAALLRHVVAHELGHLVDGARMTDALRAEYLRLRGIPAGTPWFGCNGCADFATPAGDFAEVYAQWQRGAGDNRSQLAPAPSAEQLEQIAARFFS
ncbi:MAG TPA: hypothetical protein VNU26_13125 [Mycobacteriales bacterium]|nr:hypothetical protein [Mycobacteriales bacterium]